MEIIEDTKKNITNIIFTSKERKDFDKKYINSEATDIFSNLSSLFKQKQFNENKQRKLGNEHTGYPFIPLSIYTQIMSLMTLKEYIKYKRKNNFLTATHFLDAGCGIGNVLRTAMKINLSINGFNSYYHGIELDTLGAKIAKAIISAGDSNNDFRHIFNEDIITFKKYKNYNVIYFYCPIKLPILQVLFEEILEDTVKKDTIIIPHLKQSQSFRRDERFKKIVSYTNNYSNIFMIEKIKCTKRKTTALKLQDLTTIPKKYHSIFKKHIKGVENEKTK